MAQSALDIDTCELADPGKRRSINLGDTSKLTRDALVAVCWLADQFEAGAYVDFEWKHSYGNRWHLAMGQTGRMHLFLVENGSRGSSKGEWATMPEALKWLSDALGPTDPRYKLKEFGERMADIEYGDTTKMNELLSRS